MGWLFMSKPVEGPKAYLDRQLAYTGGAYAHRVLRSAFVGSTYYAAVERASLADGSKIVWAAVILTKTCGPKDAPEWGYKDMDETCGPCESHCPATILALLTETDSQWANEWRARCRAAIKAKHAARRLTAGSVVKYGGREYRLLWPAVKAASGWQVEATEAPGSRYRMSFALLAKSEIVNA
jgi:hypothetical protein